MYTLTSGTVFLIAKHEFEVKRSTVLKVSDVHQSLEEIVVAGKKVKFYHYVHCIMMMQRHEKHTVTCMSSCTIFLQVLI